MCHQVQRIIEGCDRNDNANRLPEKVAGSVFASESLIKVYSLPIQPVCLFSGETKRLGASEDFFSRLPNGLDSLAGNGCRELFKAALN